MSNAVVELKPSSVAVSQPMTAGDVLAHAKVMQEVMQAVMKSNVHYGVIPGTQKPTLYKPGAEILCRVFHIADSYRIEDLSTPAAVRYRVVCVGTHQATGTVMGEGVGECSSGEEKYKWVKAYDREYAATPENRRRIRYGWNKMKREEYEIHQVMTEPADLANTVLKMAAKRAKIAMTLNVTAASDLFSQDLEDLDERLRQTVDEQPDESTPALAPERVEELKSSLNAATTKDELRRLTSKAMMVAAEAKDKAAHGAIRAYAQTLSENLPEAEADIPQ